MLNRFELAHANRGSLTAAQEKALINLAANLDRAKFRQYRELTGIYEPITQLTKQQAWLLINAISQDIGGAK